jgi:hypothetical protein
MRVAKLILVVEPGTGRTGKLAMVAYQFQQVWQWRLGVGDLLIVSEYFGTGFGLVNTG